MATFRKIVNLPTFQLFQIVIVVFISILIATRASNLLAATTSVSFAAGEDTFVKDTSSGSNFGQSVKLEADASPSIKRILARFDVSGIGDGSTIVSAKLRMYAVDASNSAGSANKVVGSWSETTTTWSNAPTVGNKIADFNSPAAVGTWKEANVTSAVSGNGTYDFYIVTTSTDGVDYSSSEASSNKPTLVVDFSSDAFASPSPLPSAAPSPSPNPSPSPSPVSSPSPSPSPVSSPSPSPSPSPNTGDPIITAAGDIACASASPSTSSCRQLDTSNLILQINPEAVLTAGDNQYEKGEYQNFLDYFDPTWGRFKSIIHPTAGNHEYSSGSASGYFDYFNGVGIQTGQAGDRSQGYYSFDVGTWHIIAINARCSNVGGCSVGSAQESWLRNDLAAHQNFCTLAYWHESRFSSGSHGSYTRMQPIWQALYDYNADLVVSGHDHDYERFAPQDANGTFDLLRGLRGFVVGTGGKGHAGLGSLGQIANSEVFNSTSFGVLKLTLHPASYDWQFVPIAGQTFTDSGTDSCH